MRPVQFILIILVLGVVYLYFSRLRSGLLDRVVVLLFAIAGIIMAIAPDLTMKIAASVGVGRGADLFLYLSLVGIGFFGLVLYSKIRDLESSIAEIVRAVGIRNASAPRKPDPSPPNKEV